MAQNADFGIKGRIVCYKTERRSTGSHFLVKWLCKVIWTCRKREYSKHSLCLMGHSGDYMKEYRCEKHIYKRISYRCHTFTHTVCIKYCMSWVKRDQLDVTCFIIPLYNAQHVSDVNKSFLRSLRLMCWVISWVTLIWFDVCWSYVVVWLWWCGIRMQVEAH